MLRCCNLPLPPCKVLLAVSGRQREEVYWVVSAVCQLPVAGYLVMGAWQSGGGLADWR